MPQTVGSIQLFMGPQQTGGPDDLEAAIIDFIDGARKTLDIAGSFNYTGPANRLNDENIIILGDLESTSATSIKAQRKLAGYALAEIDRIIEDHGERVQS